MNIDIEELREDLQGKQLAVTMADSSSMVLEKAVILPFSGENSFSICNDKAMIRGNGDIIRVSFRDITDVEKLEDDGLAYHIRCKRSGWYILSVLNKVS